MMFINAIVAAAILAASVVTAAPAADLTAVTADVLAPRQDRTIKLCKHRHWTMCDNAAEAPSLVCHNLKNADVGDISDMISSLDTRGFQCRFFSDVDCSTGGPFFDFRGSLGNLKTHTGLQQFQDQISSYRCE